MINTNDSDPDDPESFNISHNTHEVNNTSILQTNIVKDLGDLSTGPAQPVLPVSNYPYT